MYVSITVFKANGDILRESPAAAVTSSGTDAGPGRALTEDANSEEFSIKAFHTSHPHPPQGLYVHRLRSTLVSRYRLMLIFAYFVDSLRLYCEF